IRHAVCTARTMRRTRIELAFQRADEGGEKIEKQSVGGNHDVAQLILHERAEDDRANTLFLVGPVDAPNGLLCLVNARHKWQSHGAKFQALELCHEAVTHRLRRHTCLVGNEEYRSTAHCVLESCATLVERSVPPRETRSKRRSVRAHSRSR